MREPVQVVKTEDLEEEALRARLAGNARIVELFDKLKAPEAKRLASLRKYKVDSKLIEVLEGKVKEEEATAAKAAAKADSKALPPKTEPSSGEGAPEVTS
jgi:hypothetical protein